MGVNTPPLIPSGSGSPADRAGDQVAGGVPDEHDDDALSWGDDDDPTLVANPRIAELVPPRRPQTSARADESDADELNERGGQTSSVLLVVYGILAGFYLLYSIGWVTSLQRYTVTAVDPLVSGMSVVGLVLAVLGPALWFFATFAVTRHSRTIVRVGLLAAGALVLVPWPLFIAPGASIGV